MKKKVLIFIFTVLAVGVLCQSGNAYTRDAGLITELDGEALLVEADIPFKMLMKVKVGDAIKLSPESSICIVFFRSGRKEKWQGPATISIAQDQGSATNGSKALEPQVEQLSMNIARSLTRIPRDIDVRSLQKVGGVGMRAVDDADEVTSEEIKALALAKQAYDEMVANRVGSDTTPEIYYISELMQYGRFKEIASIAEIALRIKPGNSEFFKLKEIAESQQ